MAVIPDAIKKAIKNRMEPNTGLIKIKSIKIKVGDIVRVFEGPLGGINGIVTERNSESRALILMELMGRPTKVEVDALILQRTG